MKRILLMVALAMTLCTAALAQTPETWKEYTFAEANMSVSFPCTPAAETEDIKSGALTMKQTYQSCVFDGGYYMVAYADFPINVDAKAALKGFRDGVIGGIDGTVTEEKETSYGSHPGTAITMKMTTKGIDVLLSFKLFYIKGRTYAITASRIAGSDSSRVDKFLSSFALQK